MEKSVSNMVPVRGQEKSASVVSSFLRAVASSPYTEVTSSVSPAILGAVERMRYSVALKSVAYSATVAARTFAESLACTAVASILAVDISASRSGGCIFACVMQMSCAAIDADSRTADSATPAILWVRLRVVRSMVRHISPTLEVLWLPTAVPRQHRTPGVPASSLGGGAVFCCRDAIFRQRSPSQHI